MQTTIPRVAQRYLAVFDGEESSSGFIAVCDISPHFLSGQEIFGTSDNDSYKKNIWNKALNWVSRCLPGFLLKDN